MCRFSSAAFVLLQQLTCQRHLASRGSRMGHMSELIPGPWTGLVSFRASSGVGVVGSGASWSSWKGQGTRAGHGGRAGAAAARQDHGGDWQSHTGAPASRAAPRTPGFRFLPDTRGAGRRLGPRVPDAVTLQRSTLCVWKHWVASAIRLDSPEASQNPLQCIAGGVSPAGSQTTAPRPSPVPSPGPTWGGVGTVYPFNSVTTDQ